MNLRAYAISFLPFLSLAMQDRLMASPAIRTDSIATLTKSFETLEKKVQETEFEKLKSEELIDYDSSADDGADTIAHEQETQLGQPYWSDDYADDAPSFTVKVVKTAVETDIFQGHYFYTVDELDKAAMPGTRTPLPVRRKKSAMDGMRRWHDTVAAIGSAKHGRTGFVNNPYVPLVTPTTGNFASATDDQVIADIQKLLRAVNINSGENAEATHLAVDRATWTRLNRPYGDDKSKTLRKWLLENEDNLKSIVQWKYLDTASASNGRRLVAWNKSIDVVKYNAVYVYREEPPQKRGLKTIVHVYAKTGFTEWRKPLYGAYMDGI